MIIRLSFIVTFVLIPVSILWLWNHNIGFVASDIRWWVWLRDTVHATGSLPNEIVIPLFVVGAVALLVIALLIFIKSRVNTQTLHGQHGSKTTHGSATWATRKDIKDTGLLSKTGVTVGGYKNRLFGTSVLKHNGPEHILTFAPTRSGKGVGLVLPTLLSWKESVLVLDIKGENYALTAGWRKSIGQRVLRFDPAAMEGSVRYNPLAEVRLGTDFEIADCQNIASMVIDPDGKGLKDYWTQSGWEWLTACTLHVLYYIKLKEGRTATLADVHKFMSIGQDDDTPEGETSELDAALKKSQAKELGGDESFDKLCDDMSEFDHGRDVVNQEVERSAGAMKKKASQERSGVHSSAKVQLSLYSDPIVANNISHCDFRIDDLMNAENPTSLYIVIPPSDIDRLKPLIRILMNQFLTRLTSEMSFKDGAATKGYKHRLLLMLDEFTSIGKLEIFERSLAFMAGYGLKAYIIVQDLTQLQKTYGREESITSNCHIRIAYAPNKTETAKLLSDMTGKTTLVQKKTSRSSSTSRSGVNVSESLSEVSRPLMTPDECMSLPGMKKKANGDVRSPGDMLIFVAGSPTIYGQQYLYFKDKELLKKAKIPAPQK